MKKRILGKTGLKVSVLGMGGLFVSKIGERNREQSYKAVNRALVYSKNSKKSKPPADPAPVLTILFL